MIVRITSNYSGDVWVEKDGEQINGKSIMGLMMLAAGNGSKLNFLLEGPSEEAKNILVQLESYLNTPLKNIKTKVRNYPYIRYVWCLT